jgi:uncharacterized membrane protein YedE/YeeE
MTVKYLCAFFFGGLFGIGLVVAGGTDTRVIIGWLDVFGRWNPTLAVMFAASAGVMAVAWRIAARHRHALLGAPMPSVATARVDKRLVAGSLIFGLGWGLAGICPGPSVAALTFGGWNSAVFFGAMVTGMLLARLYTLRAAPAALAA